MDYFKTIWLELYPLLCVFVPCIIYQIAVRKTEKKKLGTLKYWVWSYIFILYIYLALNVAGGGCVWDIGHYPTVVRLDEINLVPFQSEGGLTYILNVIMFMPFGFLLPLIWKRYEKPVNTIIAGAVFSLLIEITQLFNRRKTDIDDLIMNVIGSIVGYLLYLIYKKMFKTKTISSDGIPKIEPMVYVALAMLGNFLLYNWRFFVKIFYY